MAGDFILASSSPRRRELLAQAGYQFDICRAAVEEIASDYFSLAELTLANATRKGLAVVRQNPARLLIAADTLVGLDGELFGKPANMAQARSMLRRLSGKTHQVCTTVFIAIAGGEPAGFAEWSSVRFRQLSEKAIVQYLGKIDPLDKAGAYAAQESGSEVIESIEGSVSNVVGLSIERTVAVLAEFGIRPRLRHADE